MNNLIILNYGQEIPPFMISQIEVARTIFDKVYYVTRHMTNDNSDTIRCFKNVEIIEITPHVRKRELILSPIKSLGRKWFLYNYFSTPAVKGKLKSSLITAFASDCLYYSTKQVIEECLARGEKVAVLATWFLVEAVTVARLQKKYPEIKSASYAHSYEIDPDKSLLVPCGFNNMKLKNIDEIYFISSRMRDIYFDTIKILQLKEEFYSKTKIQYLGCIKKYNTLATASTDGVFRICSCAFITPVKRLHLIAQALQHWSAGPIEWTHLGNGPLENEIRETAEQTMSLNPLVKITFTGYMTNLEVQEYLSTHTIDLLVSVSFAEGLPVSIMESFAYGIPALATNVGGNCEIITKETGILINRDSTPEEIAKAMRRYYLLPDSAKSKYREAAYKLWTSSFNAKINAVYFYNHIKSLC